MPKNYIYTFFLFLYAFGFKAQGDSNRIVLNVSNIISIEMKKVNPKNHTLQRELFLKEKDIILFVNRWNTMNLDTLTELLSPKYFFFVNLKNKNVVYISSGKHQLTDQKCYLTATDNEMYFDKLYNSLTE